MTKVVVVQSSDYAEFPCVEEICVEAAIKL